MYSIKKCQKKERLKKEGKYKVMEYGRKILKPWCGGTDDESPQLKNNGCGTGSYATSKEKIN